MKTVILSNNWKCIDFSPHSGDVQKISTPGFDTSLWHNINIPDDVNAMLVRVGRMPDPHYGDNGRRCYWVTSREWWYRLEFSGKVVGKFPHTDLCMDGVDGFADLYLNGEKLGRMENAFQPYRFDITRKLKMDAPNVILVCFQSIDETMGGQREDELGGWDDRRTLMRKPQFSFGWDWSLPLPSIGITSVRLESYMGPRLLDISVKTFVSGRVDFKFQVNTAARDSGYAIIVRIQGHGINLEKRLERPGRVFSYISINIDNPHLWWPNGMGEQALYNYEVVLVVNGEIADRRIGKIGIREICILEEPFTKEAGPGISFWLQINGQRVFCKGGNWIPMELWPAMAVDEQYHFYIKKAAEANFNMLRVWGGGIYERDIFYDLCDEMGIMVWQDFMFASAGYPVDLLRQEIIAEAEYQIKRLRNHACVVLWCGCNEDVFSWSLPDEKAMATADTGVYSQSSKKQETNRLRDDPQIYSMILRGLVSRLGLGVPYVESSPQSYEDAGNMPESGNSHISCWKYALFETSRSGKFDNKVSLFESDSHPEEFRKHFDKVCSFDSEFCIQGPCDLWTFKKFLPEDHLWPPDDVWIYHIQRGHYNIPHYEQTIFIAESLFGKIDSLQKYVKYGQATHAEMMRAEFESARRDRPNNGGTMVWMYNDCWPTSNWSIIDYYRRPKPSYYAAKRACATYLPIIFERRGRIEFFLSNDGRQPGCAEISFGQERIDGSIIWSKGASIRIGGCETVCFYTMKHSELRIQNGDYLFIDASIDGNKLPRITYFPDMWKNIKWPVPNISLEMIKQKSGKIGWITQFKITTDAYARFCHIILPSDIGPFWLDDNFFDLCAGHSHTITIWSSEKIDKDMVKIGHWHTDWP